MKILAVRSSAVIWRTSWCFRRKTADLGLLEWGRWLSWCLIRFLGLPLFWSQRPRAKPSWRLLLMSRRTISSTGVRKKRRIRRFYCKKGNLGRKNWKRGTIKRWLEASQLQKWPRKPKRRSLPNTKLKKARPLKARKIIWQTKVAIKIKENDKFNKLKHFRGKILAEVNRLN